MGFFKRLFGICDTKPPADSGSWKLDKGTLELDLGRVPELEGQGGAVRLEGDPLPSRVLVVHGQDGSFHAFENKCTHGGRRIDPLAGEEKIRCCSVGKSTFDYEGKRLSGSAKEDLKVLSVTKDEGSLKIRLE